LVRWNHVSRLHKAAEFRPRTRSRLQTVSAV
jgi:hypothetical protein